MLLETTADIVVEKEELERLVKQAVLSLVGQLGYYDISPKLISVVDKNHIVMRCRLRGYKRMLLVFSLIKRLGSMETGIYTLKSSGTLKALLK
jgi:RNase P/RNase MRP subunit POP5